MAYGQGKQRSGEYRRLVPLSRMRHNGVRRPRHAPRPVTAPPTITERKALLYAFAYCFTPRVLFCLCKLLSTAFPFKHSQHPSPSLIGIDWLMGVWGWTMDCGAWEHLLRRQPRLRFVFRVRTDTFSPF
eukprot:scaffold62695_cov70-Phaeocystis_antarctica.AAC.2